MLKSIRLVLPFAILSAILVSGTAFGDDWPYYRGPNRNGVADVRLDLLDEPEELWKADVGSGRGSMVISGGKLYVHGKNSEGKNVNCLDAKTGEVLWTVNLETWFADSTPAVADGKLYAIGSTNDPQAYCLDAASGKEIWKTKLPKNTGTRHYGHAGSPLIAGDLVVFNTGTGAALNRRTGKTVWEFPGLPGLATPVLFRQGGKPAVAIFCGDKLIARNLADGKQLWSIDWKTNLHVNACDPVFIDDDSKVFICSDYGFGRALYDISGDEPRELWNHGRNGDGHAYSSGFFVDGKLYGFVRDFCRLDTSDGAIDEKVTSHGSALYLGDTLVLLTGNGVLRAGKFKDGQFEPAYQQRVIDRGTPNVPAYADGKLFVRNEDGVIAALKISR